MSYTAIESSVQQGAPVELYQVFQGAKRWYYCTGEQPVTYQSIDYTPYPIRRDRIKQSTDVFKNSIRLTFPRDNDFASQFIGFAPEDVTSITVLRGHYTDTAGEFITYWKGRVQSAKATDSQVELECEPIYTSIRRPGLRAKFEYGCRHALYGHGCGVGREAYKLEGLVLDLVGGLNVTVQGASLFPDGYFTGGILVSDDAASRFIVGHVGAVVTVSRPINSLAAGQNARLYPGCDHLRTTCESKFNNLDNFGGFPWIPSRNPFDGSSIA